MAKFGVDKNRIKTVGYGTVLLNRKPSRNNENKVKFICSGWFTNRKNQLEIIEAVNNLPEDIVNNIEISFYGEGPLLKDVIQKCNPRIKKAVRFMGKKPREEVLAALSESDVLLSTSMSEGYSQSALEAVGAGVALVSTPVGGFKEIIAEAKNGVILDYRSESVEKVIMDLVLNKDLLTIYKQRSRRFAASHTWEKQVKKMLHFINND